MHSIGENKDKHQYDDMQCGYQGPRTSD